MDQAESAMKQDANLKEKWLKCFPQEEVDAKLVRCQVGKILVRFS